MLSPNTILNTLLMLCAAGGLFCSTAIAGARMDQPASPDAAGIIQLRNRSSLKLTAKLVGPAPRAVELEGRGIFTFTVPPGYYYLLFQYHEAGRAVFLKTTSLNLKSGADNKLVIHAVAGEKNCLITCLDSIVTSSESEFNSPDRWPAAGVKTETNPHFNTLKLIVLIQDLYNASDEDQTRGNAVYAIKPVLNRAIAQEILAPLRQQGFKVTYTGISNTRTPPERYAEPTMLIAYNESEGKKFHAFRGVDIECRVAVYAAGGTNSEPMWEEWLEATNDSEVRIDLLDATQTLRINTLKDLKSKFADFILDLSNWKLGN